MNADSPPLGRANAAFALSAAITILFNTVLACAKDAYSSLKIFMASLSDHDWTTQGIADVLLFVLLGLTLLKTSLPEKLSAKGVIYFLVSSVVIAGIALFAWYALY
ncbi:MAG: hypothetical protein WAN10_05315 [Candidatus Acidiferrales bacterium]